MRTVQQGWFRLAAVQRLVDGRRPGSSLTGLLLSHPGRATRISASPVECNDTAVKFLQYTFEAAEVFAVALPDVLTGACPLATQPVYRLWNSRAGDPNHRYTTSLATRTEMIALGLRCRGVMAPAWFSVPTIALRDMHSRAQLRASRAGASPMADGRCRWGHDGT